MARPDSIKDSMNKILRAIVIAAAVFMLAQAATACAPQKAPIRIAVPAWAGVEPADLAAQLGYFEKYGVDVKIVRFSVYSDSIEALVDRKVDAGMHTLGDIIRCQSEGRDVRILLLTDYSFGSDGLVARPGIESLADLRGKKIGVETGSASYLSLLKILEMGGMTSNDVTIVSIPTREIQKSMLEHRIDAGILWETYLTSTAEATGGKVLITSHEYPETIISTLSIDAALVEDRPEDVRGIVAAYFDAVEYIKANPQDAYQRMGKTGISESDFEKQAAGGRFYDLSANARLFGKNGSGQIYAQAQSVAQFLFDQGLIPQLPDIKRIFEPSFVQALNK